MGKLIDSIASRLGYAPIAKPQKRGYSAAAINRLTNDWTTALFSADSALRYDLKTLRARSRDAALNFDYGVKFLTMLKNNVLGEHGIQLRNKAKDPDRVQGNKLIPGQLDIYANKIIEDRWWDWGQKANCTVTKSLTWKDAQDLALETVAADGGCLIRKVPGFANNHAFAIQFIDIDCLDFDYTTTLSGGNFVQMGVEYNVWREPIAYHVWTENPYEYSVSSTKGRERQRISASEIIYGRIGRRINQTHGVPWLATPMKRMKMLDGYEESELVASRVAAAKMGFFKATGDAQYQGEQDGAGNPQMEAEPGSFETLPRGLELQSWDPQHPNSNFQNFTKAVLRGVAAGLGVSYNSLANDMESVNFASGKLGLEDERDTWRKIRGRFITDICQPIFDDWLRVQLTFGLLPLPLSKLNKFNAAEWRGRRWPYINPQQEISAIRDRLRLRLTSVSRELSEQGIDRDELFDEIQDDQRAMDARGITSEEIFPTPEPQPEPVETTA